MPSASFQLCVHAMNNTNGSVSAVLDLPFASSTESSYLAVSLGSALPAALSEISDKRPWDPIEYLAHWLKKYAHNARQQQQVSDFQCP